MTMEVADSLLDLVGNTPLVRLGRVGRDLECDLLAKVEMFNPGGSVKDRPARRHDRGRRTRRPAHGRRHHRRAHVGQHRAGLAIVAAQRGYRVLLRDVRQGERREGDAAAGLRRRGRRVPDGRPARAPDSYYSVAERVDRGAAWCASGPNQYSNPANPAEHERHRSRALAADRRAASRTSSPASAPAAPSPAWAAISRRRTQRAGRRRRSGGLGLLRRMSGRPYLVEGVGEDFWPPPRPTSVVDRDGERPRIVPTPRGAGARGGAAHRRIGRDHVGGARCGGTSGPTLVVVVLSPIPAALPAQGVQRRVDARSVHLRDRRPPRRRGARRQVRRRARRSSRSQPTSRHTGAGPGCAQHDVTQLSVSTRARPLAARRSTGYAVRAPLMDRRSGIRGLDTPVEELMSRRCRWWRGARPVDRVAELLDARNRPCWCSTAAGGRHPDAAPTCCSSSREGHDGRRVLAATGRGFRAPGRSTRARRPIRDRRGGGADHQTSTFAQEAVGKHTGFEYARTRQPDAGSRRGSARLARGRAPRTALRLGTRGQGHGAPRCSAPATTWSPGTTPTAARSASWSRCSALRHRPGRSRSSPIRRARADVPDGDPAGVGRDADQSRCCSSSTSPR